MPRVIQDKAHQQFIAIVVGESSDNMDEAAAIGSVMMNRLKVKGAIVIDGFIKKISHGHSKKQYKAIGGKLYNAIMKMSWKDINNPTNKYATRICGAKMALQEVDYSNDSYFWNKTADKTGSNWNAYYKGIFVITKTFGASTFFKYKNPNRKQWP